MKKIVSLILCVLLCAPCVLAVPVAVNVTETVIEATEQKEDTAVLEASLTQEQDVVKSLFVEFENAVSLGYSMQDINDASKANGVLEFTAKVMDPRIAIPVNFNADDYDSVKVRMKWSGVKRENSTPCAQLFYYGVDKNGNKVTINESYSVKVYTDLSSDGEYRIITFPLKNSNLEGMTVTTLALDPMCNNGSVSLDYLMVVPKNDRPNMGWYFNTDEAKEGWNFNGNDGKVADGVYFGTTSADNNTYSKSVTRYKGSDYPKAYVKLKHENVTSDGNTLFYTNLIDENGAKLKPNWWAPYEDKDGNTYNYAVNPISRSNNGAYKVYEYNFGQYVLYAENYISALYFNLNKTDADLYLDYIVFPHKHHLEWDFETDNYYGGLTLSHPDRQVVRDGRISLTTSAESTYFNNYITINDLNLKANEWAGLEVVMKYNIHASGRQGRVYFAGTAFDGTELSYDETNAVASKMSGASTGEGSAYFYFDLTSAANWENSTITSLRFDPVKDVADYEVDYIRLVPASFIEKTPLDETVMKLNYEFEDTKQGTADGKITVDFGSQDALNTEYITLKWASGNSTDGYTELSDYTAVKVLSGELAQNGYTINKNMLIPKDATALLAVVTDCEKTFTLSFDIPEEKRKADRGEPLYSAGLISDIHVGGWGSETAPNPRLTAARNQLSSLADFVVVNGDVTQWYGAYSGEEFKAYNYDGTSFKDNGETSPEYLGIGTSQWQVLDDYFKGFSVPVYIVQGNHDIKDGSSWSDMIESEKYWRPFLENWISYSNNAENGLKYENAASLNDGNNYYDTEINGHHYIFLAIPKTTAPNYSFGEEQLKWLDEKLYEKEESGKPIFVFAHVPLETELNGSYWDTQIGDDAEIKAILAKHPTAIYTSGHTHYSLDVDFLSSIDGKQIAPSFIHDGGGTTIQVLKDDNDTNPDNSIEVTQSHGVVAKVYSDGIELCARDFVGEKWISRGYTYLTFKDKCEIPEITFTKTAAANGVLLKANEIEGAAYTWVLNGTQSDNTTNEILVPYDFEGYAALRVTDTVTGAYRSEVVTQPAYICVDTQDSVSMRVDEDSKKSGVRFAAVVSNNDREVINEYGFLVTRKTILDTVGKDLTFDLKKQDGAALYVTGASFLRDENGKIQKDLIYKLLPDSVMFTAVVTGINVKDASQVCETLVIRPYAKLLCDGKETVVYGETVSRSLNEAAKAIRQENSEFYKLNKEYIDALADINA